MNRQDAKSAKIRERVDYKGRLVGESRLDFCVGDMLVVELKAIEEIAPIYKAIVINYLRTVEQQLALLINFNVPLLKDGISRLVLTR